MPYEMKYLELLSRQYPTKAAVSEEIINLSAILNLPKGTEHFLADVHGEHEAFDHVMRNASGVVRRKIDDAFGSTLTDKEKSELATLVYYPEERISLVKAQFSCGMDEDEPGCQNPRIREWYALMIERLILLCRQSAYKYTRSKVRKTLPRHYQYIIEELLHENETSVMKQGYYRSIIENIVDIDRAEEFIVVIAQLIQKLVVDHLHIIGDIYDRGPGAEHVMDTLMAHHSVDIQWGNHDVLWIGAACGSLVCMADLVRISMRYGNLETMQDSYGLNLAPLVRLVNDHYQQDYAPTFQVKIKQEALREKDLILWSRMQKAIAVIAVKLEGQLALRRPELDLESRALLHRINYEKGTITLEGQVYELIDKDFPTVDPKNPYELTQDEQYCMDRMAKSFHGSARLQRHIHFLIDKGSMYKIHNGNLLYHGCIPLKENGEFQEFKLNGKPLSGRALLDGFDTLVRQAHYSNDPEKKALALDYVWYLWCGKYSPLFGKSKMATFERYFLAEKETHKEGKNPYFNLREEEETCTRILMDFGLSTASSYIINGHVPVKVKAGEIPIKAGGKLITIDGGFSRAYQKETGIAGYTLIFNSQGMNLVAHEPFELKEHSIREGIDMVHTSVFIEAGRDQVLVGDTDMGQGFKESIESLLDLLQAYRDGTLKERSLS